MKKVLVTGSNGLIGTHLCELLGKQGYQVARLVRHRTGRAHEYLWDPESNTIEKEALLDVFAIIHLAGENVFSKKWTADQKKKIYESRIGTANLLYSTCKSMNVRPAVFISASGANYYGAVTSDKIFTERDPPGNDFLAEVCVDWELAASRFKNSGARVCMVRTAIVLSKKGGALPEFLSLAGKGISSPLGSGKQWMPWIHIRDLCNVYLMLLENKNLSGPFNAASPHFVTNHYFLKTLSEILHRPFFLPKVPGFVLNLVLGKEKAAVLLNGSRVSPDRITGLGFRFEFPVLEDALAREISK